VSARHAARAAGRGYTLIEVMAALGVLAIGATGVVALQKATLLSNINARNLALANAIAMTWAERLRADALQWNDPGGASDIASTDWIALSATQPYPARVTPTPIVGFGMPDADLMGTDIYEGDPSQTAFCTHLRFRQFTDEAGMPLWPNLLRAEIRVVWERGGDPMDCATDPLDVDANPGRFGAVHLTTSVLRNTSQY
jgi:type IV pilus assembly protein PilV